MSLILNHHFGLRVVGKFRTKGENEGERDERER